MARVLSMNWMYDVAGARFRLRRHRRFLHAAGELMQQPLLDVGGTARYWQSVGAPAGSRIDLVNPNQPRSAAPSPGDWTLNRVVGNGCGLPFADQSYALVFSNSVIEHVGSFERQQAFAQEIRRVGRAYWVQTPARSCPVEPHYLGLFVHWLPRRAQRRLIRWTTLRGWLARPTPGRVDRMVDEIRLLRRRELVVLFPGAHVTTERWARIVPKSYLVTSGLPGVVTAR